MDSIMEIYNLENNLDEKVAAANKRAYEYNENDDVENRPITRPRAVSSEPQTVLTNVPDGIAFISLMNPRKRFFLPSSKNTFGDIKVGRVLCDSGCSSMLLPIESAETLIEIFQRFEDTNYIFSLKGSANVGGTSTCLVVEHIGSNERFTVHLCHDIMGHANNMSTKRLRFSLCQNDIKTIQTTKTYCARFSSLCLDRLKIATGPIKRRTHALLGQDILSEYCLIKYRDVEIYVDPSKYTLPRNFRVLRDQNESLANQLRRDLPDNFDDWEDDDFAFEDDEVLYDD